ncbi:MAG: enoyl-CoA hydratase/isomerase family protein [Betaproteobacteria bacterium]
MRADATTQLEMARRGRVAILTLTREGHGNRLTVRMAEQLAEALEAVRMDPEIGACVITGHGDVFCLGGDFQGVEPTAGGRKQFAEALVRMDQTMAQLGKPLVAAVNGDAHAGGFGVVISCDLAVVSAAATFGLPEAAKGLFPFIATAIVKDALPKKVFFDLVYNARLLNAQEARELRLVNEVVPSSDVLDRAIAIAERASSYNAEIVKLGRDLYYDLRSAKPKDAFAQAGVALIAALAERQRSSDSN